MKNTKTNTEELKANYFIDHRTDGDVCVAVRNDGVAFFRAEEFNGYGFAWTKWKKWNRSIELIENRDEPTIKIGWAEASGYYNKRIRLPKD